MPDKAVSAPAPVGLFGKLPAHGDFIRRGQAGAAIDALDDWLQSELARASNPGAAIHALAPMRFATTALVPGQVAVGALVDSRDRVGRQYLLIALRLAPHPNAFPDALPDAWDDWSGRAEATLIAARETGWTADATQAALEVAARSAVATTTPIRPFVVGNAPASATMVWRPVLLPGPRDLIVTEGLPCGDAFDRLLGARVPA